MRLREERKDTEFLVPKDGAIATMPLFRFLPPSYISNPSRNEIHWTGSQLEVKLHGPKVAELFPSDKSAKLSISQQFDIDSHGRLLAKIAHTVAIGHLGLNGFNPWLPPYILGEDKCLPYLVGGIAGDESPADILHQIKYEASQRDDQYLVTVQIRLFAQFGGPHSYVVVGSSTPEMLLNRVPLAVE